MVTARLPSSTTNPKIFAICLHNEEQRQQQTRGRRFTKYPTSFFHDNMGALTERKLKTSSWFLYICLIVIRIVLGALLPGYVHPDEFFQGGQELWFGCPPNTPWEFQPQNAIRSIVSPTVMVWIPLKLYSIVTERDLEVLSGQEVLIVPRIWCAILSLLIVDLSVWSLGSNVKKSDRVPVPVLLLASAWPSVVLLTRPFSNTIETFMLALLMLVVLNGINSAKSMSLHMRCFLSAIICTLGFFTRFTFIFFATPIVLYLLYKLWKTFGFVNLCFTMIIMTVLGISSSLAIVLIDTQYYYKYQTWNIQPMLNDLSNLIITPLNALEYNTRTSNLAHHGLHPRWTHALVNMFILYGPLTVVVYYFLLSSKFGLKFVGKTTPSRFTSATTATTTTTTAKRNEVSFVSSLVIISGLSFLSWAPHQEPRFLLPLLVPVVLLVQQTSPPRILSLVWILFNLILFGVFGVLHQGGVVQSLLAFGSGEGGATIIGGRTTTTTTTTVAAQNVHQGDGSSLGIIFFRTYMPPTFLSRLMNTTTLSDGVCPSGDSRAMQCNKNQHGHNACLDKTNIIDLKGASMKVLLNQLKEQMNCDSEKHGSTDENETQDDHRFVYLVMPEILEILDDNDDGSHHQEDFSKWIFHKDRCVAGKFNCQYQRSFGPHLSTEDLPPFNGSIRQFYESLSLNLYTISCKSK